MLGQVFTQALAEWLIAIHVVGCEVEHIQVEIIAVYLPQARITEHIRHLFRAVIFLVFPNFFY